MKMSVTIPQIFYDLIARVIPGFLFLLLLNLELSGTGIEVIQLAPNNSMTIVLSALVYGILSYLMGWVLGAFTFGSTRDRVKENHESGLDPAKGSISASEMYHRVRIENEAVGFRLVKLRAEAIMLETSRAGIVYIFVISLGLLLLSRLGYYPSLNRSPLEWVTRLCILVVLAVAFRKRESRAWDNYFGRSIINYEILSGTRVRRSKEGGGLTTAAPDQASPAANHGASGSEDSSGEEGSAANTPGG
jgi:hypothetical protein